MDQLTSLRARRVAVGLLAGMLVAYLIAGLWPFHWNPVRRVTSGATLRDGRLRFASEGWAIEPSVPSWAEGGVYSFQLRLQVRPYSDQGRIFSYANWDGLGINVSLSQEGDALRVRFRPLHATSHHWQSHRIANVFERDASRVIELQLDWDRIHVQVEGREELALDLGKGLRPGWQTDGELLVTLGNVINGTRPWLGEISECVVEAGGQRVDYLRPGTLSIPERYWVNLKVDTSIRPSFDKLWNFVCFIPLGVVLAFLRGARRPVVFTALCCAAASGSVELLQFGFDRMPSVSDLVMNISGGVVGALAARAFLRRRVNEVSPTPATSCAA